MDMFLASLDMICECLCIISGSLDMLYGSLDMLSESLDMLSKSLDMISIDFDQKRPKYIHFVQYTILPPPPPGWQVQLPATPCVCEEKKVLETPLSRPLLLCDFEWASVLSH